MSNDRQEYSSHSQPVFQLASINFKNEIERLTFSSITTPFDLQMQFPDKSLVLWMQDVPEVKICTSCNLARANYRQLSRDRIARAIKFDGSV